MSLDSDFIQHVYSSGLVPTETLDRILAQLPSPPGSPMRHQEFAALLVKQDILNPWQVAQIREGRTKFTLGSYTIFDSLGQGGYGQVFLAKTRTSGQLVAVKVLPAVKATPKLIARFERETKFQRQFNHPNIVRVLDAGEDGNVKFAVHEYMDAGDARRRIRQEWQLPINVAVSLMIDIADALDYLHKQGIIHRDVKPANILFNREGIAKLADFGFCGLFQLQPKGDRRYGKLVGTADYMAPDQIRNPKSPSPLWDIYSLGCTFYKALTGIVPFPKGDSRQKMIAHVRDEPMDPHMFRQDLPRELVTLLGEMMAKNPENRISNAGLIAERLRNWQHDRLHIMDGIPEFSQSSDPVTPKAILDFSVTSVKKKTTPPSPGQPEESFRFEELDLGELKSETMDLSSSQCLVTLPGHDEPTMIPSPPVFEPEHSGEDHKQYDSAEFLRPGKPILLLIALLLLLGIFLLLLILVVKSFWNGRIF